MDEHSHPHATGKMEERDLEQAQPDHEKDAAEAASKLVRYYTPMFIRQADVLTSSGPMGKP